jgi:hypothetical protein
MAAVRNAFDLLAGGAEQPTVLSGKAKKKNKKKSSQPSLVPEGSEAPITAAPVVPAASEPPKLQSAKDAGQALEAAVVATGAGEWGALALQWTDQVGEPRDAQPLFLLAAHALLPVIVAAGIDMRCSYPCRSCMGIRCTAMEASSWTSSRCGG